MSITLRIASEEETTLRFRSKTEHERHVKLSSTEAFAVVKLLLNLGYSPTVNKAREGDGYLVHPNENRDGIVIYDAGVIDPLPDPIPSPSGIQYVSFCLSAEDALKALAAIGDGGR